MLTSSGTSSRQAPGLLYNEALYNAGVEDLTAYTKPLVQNTEYYIYSFASTDAEASSPLSKATFKTGAFIASENCQFEVTASVERQDVTIAVTPSNKNTTYLVSLTEASYYGDFDDDLQFAVDDVFWTKSATAEGKPFADHLQKGNKSLQYLDCKAATAYEICVYGCTSDGVITTAPVLQRIVTKGTIDGASVGSARAPKVFCR